MRQICMRGSMDVCWTSTCIYQIKVPEPCSVADVGKFLQKAMRSARSTFKLGKVGLCSPFQLLLSGIFLKIMIQSNLSKKIAFFPENVLYHLGHLFNVLWKSREIVPFICPSGGPYKSFVVWVPSPLNEHAST